MIHHLRTCCCAPLPGNPAWPGLPARSCPGHSGPAAMTSLGCHCSPTRGRLAHTLRPCAQRCRLAGRAGGEVLGAAGLLPSQALTLTIILRGGCCACRRACLGAVCGGRACAEEVVLEMACAATVCTGTRKPHFVCCCGSGLQARSLGPLVSWVRRCHQGGQAHALRVQRSAICRRGGVRAGAARLG